MLTRFTMSTLTPKLCRINFRAHFQAVAYSPSEKYRLLRPKSLGPFASMIPLTKLIKNEGEYEEASLGAISSRDTLGRTAATCRITQQTIF